MLDDEVPFHHVDRLRQVVRREFEKRKGHNRQEGRH
jgi:hypothetical protein